MRRSSYYSWEVPWFGICWYCLPLTLSEHCKAVKLIYSLEAAIIRNAGGRARPALPSLLALDTLGNTGTIVVIHHTDCGMSHYSESEFQDRSKTKHPEIDLHGEELGAIVELVFPISGSCEWIGCNEVMILMKSLNWKNISPEKTVKQDVEYLRSFESWGKADVEIVGLVLDTFSGVVKRVIWVNSREIDWPGCFLSVEWLIWESETDLVIYVFIPAILG